MIDRIREFFRSSLFVALLVILLVLGATYRWQQATDEQQAIRDAETELSYVSPGGEFQFTVPNEWTVGANSTETDGVIEIDLNGPRNTNVNKAFAEQNGGEGTVEDAIAERRYSDVFGTSLGQEYALLQFEVLTSSQFELTESIDTWLQDIQGTDTTASGLSYGEFEKIDIEGGEGYKYRVSSFDENGEFVATGYFLLGERAEADILFYPANSTFAEEAEDIIRSFKIVTDEDIEQFIEQNLEPTATPEEGDQ